MSESIQQKMEKAVELNKQLTDSMLIKSMFPEIKFPVIKHLHTRFCISRGKIIRSQQAVRSYLIDNAEVKYPLTLAQYESFSHQMFPANQKEWEVA